MQPRRRARRTASATPVRSSIAPVFVAPAVAATIPMSPPSRCGRSVVGGQAAALVTADEHDVEIEQLGRLDHRRVGRGRTGHPHSSVARTGAAPHVAADGEAAEVAGRSARDEAPAGLLRQPGEAGEPGEDGILGGDGCTGLLPALAAERPGADDGVEERRRGRRRGRDVGEEAVVVEGDVVRQQHVVDDRQRGVDADAVRRDRVDACHLVGRRRATQRRPRLEVPTDPRRQLVGQPLVLARPPVELHRRIPCAIPVAYPAADPSSESRMGQIGRARRAVAGRVTVTGVPGGQAGGSSRLAVSDCRVWPSGRRTWTWVVEPT